MGERSSSELSMAGRGAASDRLRTLCRALAEVCSARQVAVWLPDLSGHYAVCVASAYDVEDAELAERWTFVPLADAPKMREFFDGGDASWTSWSPATDGVLPAAMAAAFSPSSLHVVRLTSYDGGGVITIEPADRLEPTRMRQLVRRISEVAAVVEAQRAAALWAREAELLLELNDAALAVHSLNEMLAVVCHTLARRIGVSRVSVHLRDDSGVLRPTASRRADGKIDMDAYRQFVEAPVPYALAEEVVRTGQVVTVMDPASPLVRGYWQDTFDIEAALGLPLTASGETIGALTISTGADLRVYDDTLRLAAAVSAQVGIFVARTRAQERHETSLAVATYGRRLLGATESGKVSKAARDIAEGLREASGCDVAAVCLVDGSGRLFTAGPALHIRMDDGQHQVAAAVGSRRMALTEPLFVDGRRQEGSWGLHTDDGELTRFAILPVQRDQLWRGVLVCGAADDRFWRSRQRDLLDQLAGQTLLALENVSLRQSEQHRLQELRAAATQDPLTGLANRRAFMEALNESLTENRRVGVLFIDLDQFKEVNDRHGHDVGDRVLQAVARTMQRSLRQTDLAARLAGDEFTVLLRDISHVSDVAALAERLVPLIAADVVKAVAMCSVTASIGAAIGAGGAISAEDLLQQADRAMYASKREGGGRVQLVSRDRRLTDRATPKLTPGAIRAGELRAYYQPVVPTVDCGPMMSVEALVRWQHPTLGLLGPDRFLATAETSGLLADIDRWMIKQSTSDLSRWQRSKVPVSQVWINLSSQFLSLSDSVNLLCAAIEEETLDRAAIGIEVPESTVLNGGDELTARLRQLTDVGFSLALDDVGAGVTTLRDLQHIAATTVKIDRSIIAAVDEPTTRAVVRGVASICHELGVRVVAEGIESQLMQDVAVALGIDAVQGYLHARPMAEPDLLAWFRCHALDRRQLPRQRHGGATVPA